MMVQWQLDTGVKQFLPHLSSPICNIVISPSGNSYVIKLADNSVTVLSARELRAHATVAGLQAGPKENSSSAAAVLDPKQTDHLLIAVPVSQQTSRNARKPAGAPLLQTYDIRADCHVSRQALTRTNVTTLTTSPEGHEITTPDVLHLDVSKCGGWLATVDVWRPNPDYLRSLEPNGDVTISSDVDDFQEIYLKFWKWNGSSGLWELVTRIGAPHFSGKDPVSVLDLAAQSCGRGFATIGRDAVLRLWCPFSRQLNGIRTANQRLETWRCKSSICLKGCVGGFDDDCALTAACIAFSEDGSVLAASLQSSSSAIARAVTLLVDVQAGRVCHSRLGLFSGVPRAVEFSGQWLIIASEHSLSVWDTVDDSVRVAGSSRFDVDMSMQNRSLGLLAVNSKARTFAVSTSNKKRSKARWHVHIYDLDSLTPLYDVALKSPAIALLLDSFSENYIVVDAAANVRRVGHLGEKTSKATAIKSRDLSTHVSSGLAGIMGSGTGYRNSAGALTNKAETDGAVLPRKQLDGIFNDVPPFSLPSVGVLFRDVVKSLA